MSASNQDPDPGSTTDEDVTDTKEELIKKCEEMWKNMEEVSIEIKVIYWLITLRFNSISIIDLRKKEF